MSNPSPRLLVFGANGQVGTALREGVWPGTAIIPIIRTQVDLTDPTAIIRALADHRPDMVVNAAAYTAVDRAEQESDAAFAANRDGPAHLAAACTAAGIPLLHLSTDYVFDGNKVGAYAEDDPIAPLGVYGHSKAEGEAAVRTACPRHLIIRTSWVFSAHGMNFVRTMLRLGAERSELRVVADQTGCPTAAADIAAMIVAITGQALARDDAWGTYHFAGAPETTWHGFARAIFAERLRLFERAEPQVGAITTADWPTPVRRPANSALDCSLMTRTFGISPPDWRKALAGVIANLDDVGQGGV